MVAKEINRLRAVLTDKGKTTAWLAQRLFQDKDTVDKWCANVSQPRLHEAKQIGVLLDKSMESLIKSPEEYKKYVLLSDFNDNFCFFSQRLLNKCKVLGFSKVFQLAKLCFEEDTIAGHRGFRLEALSILEEHGITRQEYALIQKLYHDSENHPDES